MIFDPLLDVDVGIFLDSGAFSAMISSSIESTGGFLVEAKDVSDTLDAKELPRVSFAFFCRNLLRVRGGENINDPTGYWDGVVRASRTEKE